jgi:hypothetical protein
MKGSETKRNERRVSEEFSKKFEKTFEEIFDEQDEEGERTKRNERESVIGKNTWVLLRENDVGAP